MNSAGDQVNLSQEENKVVILPPRDRYGELALAGNISDNKGEGIELLALVGDVPVKLAGFSLKSEGGYRVDTGAVTEGLFIEGGKLVYRYRAGGAVKTSSVFALRVKSGTICPGDDFLLRFGLAENESIVGTAAAADYCAVYDKKLLWRANLYIDEGGGDWNNVNAWNDSVNNEWYRDQGVDGADVAGGQIDIRPWSRWSDNTLVENHVAYGWGCWDEVSGFNAELEDQKNLILNLRTNSGAGDTVFNQAYSQLLWAGSPTTAPGGDWNNYVFPARILSDNAAYYRYRTLTAQELSANGNDQHAYFVNGSTRSVPGLSTKWYMDNTKDYQYEQTAVTSGIDCSGLAHRSTKYSGSSYWVANSADKYGTYTFAGQNYLGTDANGNSKWSEVFPTHAGSYQMHPGTWKLESDKPADAAQRELDRQTISRAVPGDVFVVGGSHVVIIQNIRIPAGSDVITSYDQVDVIHATSGGTGANATWQVQHNTWREIGDNYQAYQLRRLR